MICSKCHNEYEDDGKQSSMCPNCRSLMGKRNKRKGSSNELRFSKNLQEQFDKYKLPYKARRTPRSGAMHEFEAADILISAPPHSIFSGIHLELKNTASWSIREWYDKIIEQEKNSGKNRIPVIVARYPSEREEFAIIPAEFLIKLLIVNDLIK